MRMENWFDHIDLFGIGIIIFAFIGINTSLNRMREFFKQFSAREREKH